MGEARRGIKTCMPSPVASRTLGSCLVFFIFHLFIFHQDCAPAPAHRSRQTAAFLRLGVPCRHVEPENWPPNSPDSNPVDYLIKGALQQLA